MNIIVEKTSAQMAEQAAIYVANALNNAIQAQGSARLVLSTGASQLEAIEALVKKKVDWSCVTMFHLDEYVDLPETHIASFRKYLKERFVNIVNPKEAFFVDGENPAQSIACLTEQIAMAPIDVALIGIGENGHIAFNDPPANFETEESYMVVTLNETCKQQQMNEGWFATMETVPTQAISMTVKQIMKCKKIVSIVPGERKAKAIKDTLSAKEISNLVPATMLKTHADWTLFLDANSAAEALPYLKD